MREISREFVSKLIDDARQSFRRRKHANFHTTYDEPVQRLMNAICWDTYIRPHRHRVDGKLESLFAIQGRLAVVVFSDSGAITEIRELCSESYSHTAGGAVACELMPSEWHTVFSLTPVSVLLEIKAGPFNPQLAKEFAHWAPPEESEAVVEYVRQLRSKVDESLGGSAKFGRQQ